MERTGVVPHRRHASAQRGGTLSQRQAAGERHDARRERFEHDGLCRDVFAPTDDQHVRVRVSS
jgi:hypothetical protein